MKFFRQLFGSRSKPPDSQSPSALKGGAGHPPIAATLQAHYFKAQCDFDRAAAQGPIALEVLVSTMDDCDRRIAEVNLARFNDRLSIKDAKYAMDKYGQLKREAASALCSIGGIQAIDSLVSRLGDSRSDWDDVSDIVVRELINRGIDAVGPLRAYLRRCPAYSPGFGYDARDVAGEVLLKIAEGLVNAGDVRAMQGALVAVQQCPRYAPRAMALLKSMLEQRARTAGNEDLQEAARLDGVVMVVDEIITNEFGESHPGWAKKPMDCSLVRQTAQKELSRRGIGT